MHLSQKSKPILSLFCVCLIPATQKGFRICPISFFLPLPFFPNKCHSEIFTMEYISIHFLQLHSRDGGLFLIFPMLSLQIKPLFLIFQHGTSAGRRGSILIWLSPLDGSCGGSGLQTLQKTLIPSILWGQGRMHSDTPYQSKNTEAPAAKNRDQGQNQHCHCS